MVHPPCVVICFHFLCTCVVCDQLQLMNNMAPTDCHCLPANSVVYLMMGISDLSLSLLYSLCVCVGGGGLTS